jgi:multiple sugar transport system permease protein
VSTLTEPTRERPPAGTPPVSRPGRLRALRALRSRTVQGSDARWGLAMSVPTLCVLVLIVIVPAVWTILLAFQRVTLLNIRTAGISGPYSLANIEQVIKDPGFVSGIIATLVYSVFGTLLSVVLGLGAAMALRRRFRGRGLVRAVMLLPYVAPVVAAAYVWQVMLNPAVGLVNQIGTRWLGWNHAIPFLSQQAGHPPVAGHFLTVPTALIMVILFDAWRYFPFAFLFYSARIQALSPELEEAAEVDGATVIKRFTRIIYPQLRNVTLLLVLLRFIWTFNKFDDVYLLTGGGAGTQVVSIRVYQFLTAYTNVGAASAEALLLAVLLGVFAALYSILQRRSSQAAS